MRSISKITSYLLSALFLLVVVSEKSWGEVSDEVLKEAKSLAKLIEKASQQFSDHLSTAGH